MTREEKEGYTRNWMKEKLGSRGTDELIDWLDSVGYFECPAAQKYHSNYKGGLYDHSIKVAEELQNLTDKLGLRWECSESPYVVGLFHDICKVDDYKYDFELGPFSEIRFDPDHSGHGMKSVMLLAGHIYLTDEEKYCITYHMGAFIEQSEWKYFNKAIEKYPNVLYTHTADMIASKIMGI